MLPTGYEYNFLCDRKINFILRALLDLMNGLLVLKFGQMI